MLLAVVLSACAPEVAASSPAPPPPSVTVPVEPEPPAPLSCLARHYVGTPTLGAAGWALRLPDGALLPWDDGRTKDLDQRLAAPDLQDTLTVPYPTGPILPVTDPAQDPGRARVEALFDATYGSSAAEVAAALVTVDFLGQPVRFHRRGADALTAAVTRLRSALVSDPTLAGFLVGPLGGTFAWRVIAGTTRRSAHSWGVALDLVTTHTTYWEWDRAAGRPVTWQNHVPVAIVAAFEAEGFVWGGRWYHYDTMHVEYRPELFAARCAAPVDPSAPP